MIEPPENILLRNMRSSDPNTIRTNRKNDDMKWLIEMTSGTDERQSSMLPDVAAA